MLLRFQVYLLLENGADFNKQYAHYPIALRVPNTMPGADLGLTPEKIRHTSTMRGADLGCVVPDTVYGVRGMVLTEFSHTIMIRIK